MSVPPVPLMPDDDPQDGVRLAGHAAVPAPPYGYTAIILGLAALLLLRATPLPGIWALNLTLAVTGLAYLTLIAVRPRLPLLVLAIAASELGMLYSLPSVMLFAPSHLSMQGIATLVGSILVAGVIGVLAGFLLKVEEYPGYVLPINFFSIFVLMGLLALYR